MCLSSHEFRGVTEWYQSLTGFEYIGALGVCLGLYMTFAPYVEMLISLPRFNERIEVDVGDNMFRRMHANMIMC